MATARARHPARVDPTFYPTDDATGEGALQRFISEMLRALIVRLFAARGRVAFVGANQFIYWVQYRPTTSVAPDVYVLPGVDPDASVPCWKIWESGIAPSFALEVVSDDVRKDYERAPRNYAELGASELVVFDPLGGRGKRVRWQVYRRLARRGFVCVEASNADRVRARSLGCWLRVVGEGPTTRVRIALGSEGDALFPTAEEAGQQAEQARVHAEQARALAEQARVHAEQARALAEQARTADHAALAQAQAEIARLRTALGRRKR